MPWTWTGRSVGAPSKRSRKRTGTSGSVVARSEVGSAWGLAGHRAVTNRPEPSFSKDTELP